MRCDTAEVRVKPERTEGERVQSHGKSLKPGIWGKLEATGKTEVKIKRLNKDEKIWLQGR